MREGGAWRAALLIALGACALLAALTLEWPTAAQVDDPDSPEWVPPRPPCIGMPFQEGVELDPNLPALKLVHTVRRLGEGGEITLSWTAGSEAAGALCLVIQHDHPGCLGFPALVEFIVRPQQLGFTFTAKGEAGDHCFRTTALSAAGRGPSADTCVEVRNPAAPDPPISGGEEGAELPSPGPPGQVCFVPALVDAVPIDVALPALTVTVSLRPIDGFDEVTVSWEPVAGLEEALCVAIYRRAPDESDPGRLEAILAPEVTAFATLPAGGESGEHCFRIVVLSELGRGPITERCVELRPAPTPGVPDGDVLPPDLGSGHRAEGDSSHALRLYSALAALGAALAAALALVQIRWRGG